LRRCRGLELADALPGRRQTHGGQADDRCAVASQVCLRRRGSSTQCSPRWGSATARSSRCGTGSPPVPPPRTDRRPGIRARCPGQARPGHEQRPAAGLALHQARAIRTRAAVRKHRAADDAATRPLTTPGLLSALPSGALPRHRPQPGAVPRDQQQPGGTAPGAARHGPRRPRRGVRAPSLRAGTWCVQPGRRPPCHPQRQAVPGMARHVARRARRPAIRPADGPMVTR
jgi:hypothetical protein